MNQNPSNRPPISPVPEANEEGAGLIAHAQDNPSSRAPSPYHEYGYYREDQPYESDLGYRGAAQQFRQEPLSYQSQTMGYQGVVASQVHEEPSSYEPQTIGYQDEQPIQPQPVRPQQTHTLAGQEYYQVPSPPRQETVPSAYPAATGAYDEPDESEAGGRRPRDSTQMKVGQALWGPNPHQHAGGPMI